MTGRFEFPHLLRKFGMTRGRQLLEVSRSLHSLEMTRAQVKQKEGAAAENTIFLFSTCAAAPSAAFTLFEIATSSFRRSEATEETRNNYS
jgi:hypothetical protein